jgi:hypothetical protein
MGADGNLERSAITIWIRIDAGSRPPDLAGSKRSPKTMPLDAAACVQTANLHSRNFPTMSAPRRHKTHK